MGGFSYVTGVTDLSHRIIQRLFPLGGTLAMDATLGNGHDTDFLATLFKNVYAMDISCEAVDRYEAPANVLKFCMNHAAIESFPAHPDLIVYNLGYLPGSDKTTTTCPSTTLASLDAAVKILKAGGFISVALYTGHDGGREAEAVLQFAADLPSANYGVIHHGFINRGNHPPSLLIIEKKRNYTYGNNESRSDEDHPI